MNHELAFSNWKKRTQEASRWRKCSRIRNPSYLGLVVNMLGWALTFRSGVGVLLTALVIPTFIARIHSGERLLREHFGAEYDVLWKA